MLKNKHFFAIFCDFLLFGPGTGQMKARENGINKKAGMTHSFPHKKLIVVSKKL